MSDDALCGYCGQALVPTKPGPGGGDLWVRHDCPVAPLLATIKRLEEERDEKIAMDADMAGAGCGRCRTLSARLESAEAVVEAARKVERSATQRTSATIIGLGTLRAALAAHDASRPQPEGEVTK
jgi:hypothetical protein